MSSILVWRPYKSEAEAHGLLDKAGSYNFPADVTGLVSLDVGSLAPWPTFLVDGVGYRIEPSTLSELEKDEKKGDEFNERVRTDAKFREALKRPSAPWASARLCDHLLSSLPRHGAITPSTLSPESQLRRLTAFRAALAPLPAAHVYPSLDLRRRVVRHLVDLGIRGYALSDKDVQDTLQGLGESVSAELIDDVRRGGLYLAGELGDALDDKADAERRLSVETMKEAARITRELEVRKAFPAKDLGGVTLLVRFDNTPRSSEELPRSVKVRQLDSLRSLWATHLRGLDWPAGDIAPGLRVCDPEQVVELNTEEEALARKAPTFAGPILRLRQMRGEDTTAMQESDFHTPGTNAFRSAMSQFAEMLHVVAPDMRAGERGLLPIFEAGVRGFKLPPDVVGQWVADAAHDPSGWPLSSCLESSMAAVKSGTVRVGELFADRTIVEAVKDTFLDAVKALVAGKDELTMSELLEGLDKAGDKRKTGPQRFSWATSMMRSLGFYSDHVGTGEDRHRAFVREGAPAPMAVEAPPHGLMVLARPPTFEETEAQTRAELEEMRKEGFR